MGWFAVVLAVLGLAAVAVWWFFGRDARERARVARLADLHGAARCRAACDLLEELAEQDSLAIARAWQQLEPLLLPAMPDCPPDLKPRLAEALLACHAVTRHRATQKGLMDLRRGVQPD